MNSSNKEWKMEGRGAKGGREEYGVAIDCLRGMRQIPEKTIINDAAEKGKS